MNNYQKGILQQAIKEYGPTAQLWVVLEEMSELAKEICKSVRGKDNTEEIAEEVADVEIMLEQVKMIFGVHDLVEWNIAKKVCRLKNRLAGTEGDAPE